MTPEDAARASELMKSPQGRAQLYDACRTLVAQGHREWAYVADQTVSFEMSERKRCELDLSKMPYANLDARWDTAMRDPIERFHAYMKLEGMRDRREITNEMFEDMTGEMRQKYGPLPDDSPTARMLGSLPRDEAIAQAQKLADISQTRGISMYAVGQAIDHANQNMAKVLPQNERANAEAEQMLSGLGLQRIRGLTATQTLAKVLQEETGENGTGSRQMPFDYKASPEEKLNFLADRVRQTHLGQYLERQGTNVRQYIQEALTNVHRAEITDGVLQKRAHLADTRKVDFPREEALDSVKSDRNRKQAMTALWDVAELRGKIGPERKHVVANDMDLAVRAAFEDHTRNDAALFNREHHISPAVAKSYEGLSIGYTADDDDPRPSSGSSVHDDVSNSYAETEA